MSLAVFGIYAQDAASPDPKQRVKAAREFARQGSEGLSNLRPLIKDPVLEVRTEAVKGVIEIGTQYSIDPLIEAAADNEPTIQIRATEGLVNFYYPGFLSSGANRVGAYIRSKLSDGYDQVVPAYVTVRPDVIAALAKLARGGSSMESRATAARAIGILRGKQAVPELTDALRSKDDRVILESLLALQKIKDPSAAPRVVFLLRDLNEKIQIAALETTGLLMNKEAVPDVQKAFDRGRNEKIRRAALASLAMLADESSRNYFQRGFTDKDDGVRAAAAEGFARLNKSADLAAMQKAFGEEKKMAPRLALAFAVVGLGNREVSEMSPLQYLVNTLNSRQHHAVAEAYLIELARDGAIRQALYPALRSATKDEKMGLARVLSISGDRESLPYLEPLAKDPDREVAQESLRALRTLKLRVP
ncbi:MAG TPA: HEAT repeat domain-containing protein [Bryobacteraceae bacterium]|nr:HEAT repeat domain-containing protein [Bryobacteraceae bacterium]